MGPPMTASSITNSQAMFWTGIQQLLPVICLILPITDAFALMLYVLFLQCGMRKSRERDKHVIQRLTAINGYTKSLSPL